MSTSATPPSHPVAYWTLVAMLLAFGMLAIFSIGAPFLLLGLTLAVVAPWRHRPTMLWPAVAAWIGFVLGLLLALPWSCSSTIRPVLVGAPQQPGAARGSCSTALGLFHYGTASPSPVPALITALALAVLAAATAHRILARRPKPANQEEPSRKA
jgi:hypothetical protein